jgi:hypothetical protein
MQANPTSKAATATQIGALLLAGLAIGCLKPDLVVEGVQVKWDAVDKRVAAQIRNLGGGTADDVDVYFTLSECPASSNYRPQTTHTIPSLGPGETATLESDFAPLARAENANLANVRAVVVSADPKNLIDEGREDNNEKTASLRDTSTLQDFTYNEALASVLRGVRIDPGPAVQHLDIAPGYYRLREFRVLGQSNQRVVTLAVAKDYAEPASGPSTLPQRDEEWVFSIVDSSSYDPTGRTFEGADFFGHTLSFALQFGATCTKVVRAKLDCVEVPLATQTFTTSQLNSCGWASEPPWTIP